MGVPGRSLFAGQTTRGDRDRTRWKCEDVTSLSDGASRSKQRFNGATPDFHHPLLRSAHGQHTDDVADDPPSQERRSRVRGLRVDRQLDDVFVRRVPRSRVDELRPAPCHRRKSHPAAQRLSLAFASRRGDRHLCVGGDLVRGCHGHRAGVRAATTSNQRRPRHDSGDSRGATCKSGSCPSIVEPICVPPARVLARGSDGPIRRRIPRGQHADRASTSISERTARSCCSMCAWIWHARVVTA